MMGSDVVMDSDIVTDEGAKSVKETGEGTTGFSGWPSLNWLSTGGGLDRANEIQSMISRAMVEDAEIIIIQSKEVFWICLI